MELEGHFKKWTMLRAHCEGQRPHPATGVTPECTVPLAVLPL